jgi:hypothetical protein
MEDIGFELSKVLFFGPTVVLCIVSSSKIENDNKSDQVKKNINLDLSQQLLFWNAKHSLKFWKL